MATVHFIQQGKGGVGKSMIASILYQVLGLLGKKVAAFDTDPVNATLAGFKEFTVTCLDILRNGDIDPRQFDTLIDTIMEQSPETHVIVDNGASSFLALNSYIKENNILGILQESGHSVFFILSLRVGKPSAIRFLACAPSRLVFLKRPLWCG